MTLNPKVLLIICVRFFLLGTDQRLLTTDRDYYFCVQVFDLIKSSGLEPLDKTLFGSYVSKTLKQWDEIVRAYQAGNVYIGELAFNLVQNVKYNMYASTP